MSVKVYDSMFHTWEFTVCELCFSICDNERQIINHKS